MFLALSDRLNRVLETIVLGRWLIEQGKCEISDPLWVKFDQCLQEYVYDKTWNELSEKDKMLLLGFKDKEKETVESLLLATSMDKKTFSVYRDRLIKRGLVFSPSRGILCLSLPRFLQYLNIVRE